MKKTNLLLISALFAASTLQAQTTDLTKGLSIWFDKPCSLSGMASFYNYSADRDWEERSLPIGNASFGGNIFGSIAAERITLNEKTLWRGGPNTSGGAEYYWNVNKESAHLLPEIRQAFVDNDLKKAAKLTRENFNGLAGYEDYSEQPFRFGSYTTLGEAYIETGLSEIGMSDYKRVLSIDSALAVVSFQKDGVKYERTYFASYPDSAMVWKFTADKPGMQNLTFSYKGNPEAEGKMVADGDKGLLYVGKLKNNGMEFALRIQAQHKGGSVKATADGKLVAKGADEVIFLLTADTDYKINFNPDFKDPKAYVGVDPVASTDAMMKAVSARSYDELKARHQEDYLSLFNRVKISLNPNAPMTLEYPSIYDLPTYKRLASYRKGKPDYKLEEIYYQYGRYLLIASSRPGNMPANLQGLWANGVDGPWRVDYHNNINIQMNYWPACPTNLAECNWPLIDFIRTLVKPGEKVAILFRCSWMDCFHLW